MSDLSNAFMKQAFWLSWELILSLVTQLNISSKLFNTSVDRLVFKRPKNDDVFFQMSKKGTRDFIKMILGASPNRKHMTDKPSSLILLNDFFNFIFLSEAYLTLWDMHILKQEKILQNLEIPEYSKKSFLKYLKIPPRFSVLNKNITICANKFKWQKKIFTS